MSSGAVQQVTDNDYPDTGCLWLPDGRRIVYGAILDQRIVMTLVDVDSGAAQPLTQMTTANQLPVWSADGREFAYTTWVGEGTEIHIADTVTDESRLLYTLPTLNGLLLRWSADARYLSFFLNAEIYVLDVHTGERVGLMGSGAQIEYNPVWSPDGSRLAFVSDRDGNHDIYVLDLASGRLQTVSDNDRFNINPGWLR